jgi:hypothetical protein
MNVGEVVIKEDGSVTFVPAPAAHIAHVAQAVCEVAAKLKANVSFVFNDIPCTARPDSTPANVAKDWEQKMELEQWSKP